MLKLIIAKTRICLTERYCESNFELIESSMWRNILNRLIIVFDHHIVNLSTIRPSRVDFENCESNSYFMYAFYVSYREFIKTKFDYIEANISVVINIRVCSNCSGVYWENALMIQSALVCSTRLIWFCFLIIWKLMGFFLSWWFPDGYD